MSISATTRGLRPGVCTSSTRPASPFDGQLIYETDSNLLRVWNGSAWKTLSYSDATNGAVLQVAQAVKTDATTSTSTTWTDLTGMSVSITPTSTSSKVLVIMDLKSGAGSDAFMSKVLRGSTTIYVGDASGSREQAASGGNFLADYAIPVQAAVYLDSPSSTSSVTYKVQIRVSAGTAYVNRQKIDTDNSAYPRTASSITVMEVAA